MRNVARSNFSCNSINRVQDKIELLRVVIGCIGVWNVRTAGRRCKGMQTIQSSLCYRLSLYDSHSLLSRRTSRHSLFFNLSTTAVSQQWHRPVKRVPTAKVTFRQTPLNEQLTKGVQRTPCLTVKDHETWSVPHALGLCSCLVSAGYCVMYLHATISIKMFYSWKNKCHITPYLPIRPATSLWQLPLSSVTKVVVVERSGEVQLYWITSWTTFWTSSLIITANSFLVINYLNSE